MLEVSRYNEWLTWRLPMFLTAGLVVIESSGTALTWRIFFQFSFIFISLVFGAVFVSVLNDFTDLEDDRNAGKSNRLQSLSRISRFLLLGISITIVSYFAFIFVERTVPRFMYLAACISFIVYSAPPFRIKKKGAWGGVADALGASFFPILFVATQMAVNLDYAIPIWQLVAMGIWSLAHGVRGILWHQYRDREFDLSIGSKTFATMNSKKMMHALEPILIIVDMTAFMLMLDHDILPVMLLLLSAHLMIALITERLLGVRHVMILSKAGQEEFMLFGTFYQTFCPIALIFFISGWSNISLFFVFLLVTLVFPDIRNNYYLLKKILYAIPVIRKQLRKRDQKLGEKKII